MRLTLVTETYPPEINGVAMTLGRLVDGLARRNWHVEVIRPRQQRDDDGHPVADGVSEYVVPGVPLPRYEGLKMGLPCGRRLRQRWTKAEHRPDVVHIATEGPLGLSALRAARKLGLPLTSTFHTNFHSYGKHYGYGMLHDVAVGYLRWIHNRCGCTIVPTPDVRDALVGSGFERLLVMGRGIDTKLFNPARRSADLRRTWGLAEGGDPANPGGLAVLYVGRLAPEKNIEQVACAFEAIVAIQPTARLVLVGDGPARPQLEKRLAGRAVFCGMRRGEDLAAHYASGDLFLFASETETFGNVVTEAMGSGLPVVAYDYAATRLHVRDGRNGLAVPLGDGAGFIRAAVRLAEDDALRRTLGAAARATAEALRWDAVVTRFAAVLECVRCGDPLPT